MMLAGKWILSAILLAGALTCALAGQPTTSPQGKSGDEEEKILQAAKVPTDNDSLLAYLKTRTLTDERRAEIEKMVADLDSENFKTREKATKELKKVGRTALPFLKRALKDSPLEVVQRAQKCIDEITSKISSEPIAEVGRLLAAREVPGTAQVLLNYALLADDPFLEEDILNSLGKVTVRSGKVDPFLLAALKDSAPEKRAAAVYVIARFGGPAHRELVRQMLTDNDPLAQQYITLGLVGKQAVLVAQDSQSSDLATLRTAKLTSTVSSLTGYLDAHCLSDEDRQRLRDLIDALADKQWTKREKATKSLIAQGSKAISLLKLATADADEERATRAAHCLRVITKDHKTDPALAATARILSLAGSPHGKVAIPPAKDDPREIKPADAVAALLQFVPFADEDAVEEEVLSALTILSVRETKVPTALVAALDDAMPARRAAAALVLGRTGTRDEIVAVRKLLKDPVPRVRYRAAQGLVAAQDKSAVPVLIELLGTAPAAWVWQVDEQLARIAGGSLPTIPPAPTAAEFRKKQVAAWSEWWHDKAASIDLADMQRGEAFLGIFTIVEFDSMQGNRQGRIYECGRDGKPRMEVTNLGGAMDGMFLPNGNVLVAESNFNRVTERDAKGNILWNFQTQNTPIHVQRLPNGNTFIAMYDRIAELKPNKEPVYNVQKGPQMFLFGASRMRDGNVAVITGQGQIVVIDPTTGKDVKTINIGPTNGWCGIDALSGGHFLISIAFANQIREVDDAGKVVWQTNFQGVFRAVKLPNGNVLACSMQPPRVAELDHSGREVWGMNCQGRPWSVRFR
jgi:HEAT repeat protein